MSSNVVIKAISVLFLLISFYSVANQSKDNIDSKSVAETLSIKSLFQTDDYRNVSLSPDGKHIALIRNQNDVPVIIIVDAATMQAVNQISFAKKDSVGHYLWANNDRLLIFLHTKQRNEERKAYYGEIYSIDIDEDKGKFVFGVRSLVHRGKIRKNVTEADYEKHLAHPRIISTLEDDPEHIIISTSQYGSEGMWVFKLNIYSGAIETLAQVDGYKTDHKTTRLWYLEDKQELWFRTILADRNVVLGRYDFSDDSWIKYNPKQASTELSIISYTQDKQKLIVSDYCGNDTISICLFDPSKQTVSSLYTIEGTDVDWLYLDNENKPYAFSYFDEYPKFKILDEKHYMAKALAGFLSKFPGYKLQVKWDSTYGEKAMLMLSSDVQPSLWYLFDHKKNKLNYVASSKKTLDVSKLHQQYSFKFKARDDMSIQGYITLPEKSNQKPQPAIILVHGGPHIRNYWGYDPEVQLLASNGYAVVQVNFRGSDGFGWKFKSVGFKQWGESIQYDILDGVNYLIANNYLDKDRLCIMGASFGGYSAVKNSLIEPSLFKCAIASSGVYDLELLIDDSEEKEASILIDRVGGEALQVSHSVIHDINKLQIPLLLAHGSKDDRTPLEQAEVLIAQLDKHNKNYQWFEFENEGHGFFNENNQYKFYQHVLQFLNEHNPVEH